LEEIEGTVSMFISVGEDPFLLAKCRKGL